MSEAKPASEEKPACKNKYSLIGLFLAILSWVAGVPLVIFYHSHISRLASISIPLSAVFILVVDTPPILAVILASLGGKCDQNRLLSTIGIALALLFMLFFTYSI